MIDALVVLSVSVTEHPPLQLTQGINGQPVRALLSVSVTEHPPLQRIRAIANGIVGLRGLLQ